MRQHDNNLLGIGAVVLAMALIGLIDNFISLIAAEASLWQFHFTRSVMGFILLISMSWVMGWRLRPKNWRAVAMRSVLFASAMVIYFGSAGLMPVSQAAAGLFTSPIWVMLVSAVFFKTRIGPWRVLAAIVGFGGAVLILNPFESGFTGATLIPIFGGLLYGLGGISTRRLCEGETTGTLVMGAFLMLGLFGGLALIWLTLFPMSQEQIAGLPYLAQGWVAPSSKFIWLTAMQAVGSIIAVGFLVRGYQVAEVSFAALSEYSFLVFVAFWTFLLWGDMPNAAGWIGGGAIVVSGMIIALRSR